MSLTVHPDGSGIARFGGFGGFGAADGTELAAVVTWTCATESIRV